MLDILVAIEWSALVYFFITNTFYAALLISAAIELRDYARRTRDESSWRMLGSKLAPQISVIAPAYNEETTLAESTRSLLGLHYPNLEVVVVNDGSVDDSLGVLRREFDLAQVHLVHPGYIDTHEIQGLYRSRSHPNLIVVDKENGGKADALNAGLNVATGELVCAIDADTLIEPDALLRMVRPFIESTDVIAAGGTVRVANASEVEDGLVKVARVPGKWLPGFQVVEYLRAFLFGRLGWNRLGGNILISGAFGLFRRSVVLDAEGYLEETVGEDLELVLRLRRHAYDTDTPHKVIFIPDPVAWTEVPETLRVLGRQRDRWHRGLTDVAIRHRKVFLNPKYGAMGMVVLPYYVIVELFAPIAEFIGLLVLAIGIPLGAINNSAAILFFLVAYGYGMLLSVFSLVLEEVGYHRYDTLKDRLKLTFFAVFENFGYRQLTVVWRLNGLWNFFRGSQDWGVMERKGLTAGDDDEASEKAERPKTTA
jgi:cellulose synthase/poly-beta-1,6-N-acetylglucosamine synthase-like glycosyltransferase